MKSCLLHPQLGVFFAPLTTYDQYCVKVWQVWGCKCCSLPCAVILARGITGPAFEGFHGEAGLEMDMLLPPCQIR